MTPVEIDAPIVAVTVYPDSARVTRRATVELAAGTHRLRFDSLPLTLRRDSVRVGGTGPAAVLGVDVLTRHQPRTTDATAAELEERRRSVAAELAELADADDVENQRAEFLTLLTRRAGGGYARALTANQAAPADVGAFADSMAEQLTAVRSRRRELTRRREEVAERLAATERELSQLAGKRAPDRLAAEVTVEVTPGPGAPAEDAGLVEVRLELSYVVDGAGWRSSYDLRLVDETLTLTWFGLVSQRSGEDWPECELLLSTARPSTATKLPELEPWYLDRAVSWMSQEGSRGAPREGVAFAAAAMPAPAAPGSVPRKRPAAPVAQPTATVEQGVMAATYRPARPVAVPADGAAHRATVAALELATSLDYVTAPVRAPEAHLRATVVNGSPHTLLPGPASVFHGGDFVGGTTLPTWAPGEKVELALGLDDRIRVERELVRRSDTKATLGSTRRREVEYRTTVANHTPRPAEVTVLDQLPVSRDEGITVREPRLDPAPAERTELGELTWRLRLAPGESREITTGVRVELAKGVDLAGWRE
ncbi:DUF4139 domain-containing protein [Micromonospora sp. NPDC049559]|uniref:DUF4139 domain-containing protein n=1 Tax=Micromonospora sp. NPDC049559 TaxID=3155923 RepID=UPI00343CA059